jgi:Fe-Mn family superoxide dismutase
MSSAAVFRNSAVRSALRASAPSAAKRVAFASTTFTRGKATLPDLPCTSCLFRTIHTKPSY